MSREIKFRAWDSWNEAMHYPAGEKFVLQFDGTIGHFNGKTYDTVEWVLMQFTGLKDKNGDEIYEGDIIKFKVEFEDQEYDNGIVRWSPGGYWTSQIENDLEELLSEELNDLEGEIIGNVHQNPELI